MMGSRTFREHVGLKLREARTEAKLSQRDAAEAVESTQASISNYEAGRRDIPLELAVRLAAEYRVELLALIPPLR